MYANEREVLERLAQWYGEGKKASLVTVLSTFGGSPRPPGSLAAIREDGLICGSVSGGCVEDDLVAEIREGKLFTGAARVALRSFGVNEEEEARYRLPCGTTLRLAIERKVDPALLAMSIAALRGRRVVRRTVWFDNGRALLTEGDDRPSFIETEHNFSQLLGPKDRVLLIGANELARYLCNILPTVGFNVEVCDPRLEHGDPWDFPEIPIIRAMPDDYVLSIGGDRHTAVIAVSHDPKLDDLALMEALKSASFYVGALGSLKNNAKRRERLAEFDLTPEQLMRLRGPVGLAIGSRTPAEIAVSIAAELIAVRHARDLGGDAAEPS